IPRRRAGEKDQRQSNADKKTQSIHDEYHHITARCDRIERRFCVYREYQQTCTIAPPMTYYGMLAGLALLGVVVGAFGTLIGAGGGFILVPVLMLIYPHESAQTVTCITLAVVFFNALSGSIAYARMGRIDYRSAILFCWTMIPAA